MDYLSSIVSIQKPKRCKIFQATELPQDLGFWLHLGSTTKPTKHDNPKNKLYDLNLANSWCPSMRYDRNRV